VILLTVFLIMDTEPSYICAIIGLQVLLKEPLKEPLKSPERLSTM